MTALDPEIGDGRALRTALGMFATGVTVVTTDSSIGPLGMTANSFASVSLDPPLVLWSPARKSLRFEAFEKADHFAVHVLGADQRDLCAQFARKGHEFDGVSHRLNRHGVPLIDGCLARMECETVSRHDGGDHLIVVARVLRTKTGAGSPLVFSQGHYGGFDPEG